MLTANSDVSKFLFDEKADDITRDEYRNAIIEQFDTLSKARPDICNIGVYRSNYRYVFNSNDSRINPNSNLSQLDWYQKTLEALEIRFFAFFHNKIITTAKRCVNVFFELKKVIFLRN